MLLVSMVTYLDRVNISVAAQPLMDAYKLTKGEMGRIFSAFILAYGLFQILGGWLADRFGPRITLTAAILWWSLFTGLTAAATRIFPLSLLPAVWALIIVRFSLGIGESAAWPNFNRTAANWIAPKDRAFATSIPLAGGGLGATLTPPLVAWLMINYGWRQSFFASALIGVIVASLWYWYVRDRAEQHPGVNPEELRLVRASQSTSEVGRLPRGTPWKAIVREPNVWLLAGINLTCGYVIYIYLTWFYTYLLEARGLSFMRGSLYTIGPFLAITILTPVGGVICDRATRRFGKNLGRRVVGMGGMLLAAAALEFGARESNIDIAIFGLSLGAGAIYFSLSSQWAVSIDISREHAGTVSGIMNWGGNTGGMISPMLMPVLARNWGWMSALEIAACLVFVGSLLWMFLKPEQEIQVKAAA